MYKPRNLLLDAEMRHHRELQRRTHMTAEFIERRAQERARRETRLVQSLVADQQRSEGNRRAS